MRWRVGRGPRELRRESEVAHQRAQESLRESLRDRDEVWAVARLARLQLEENHISPRIAKMLKGGV